MKKLISLAVAVFVLGAVFTGCGTTQGNNPTPSGGNTNPTGTETEPAELLFTVNVDTMGAEWECEGYEFSGALYTLTLNEKDGEAWLAEQDLNIGELPTPDKDNALFGAWRVNWDRSGNIYLTAVYSADEDNDGTADNCQGFVTLTAINAEFSGGQTEVSVRVVYVDENGKPNPDGTALVELPKISRYADGYEKGEWSAELKNGEVVVTAEITEVSFTAQKKSNTQPTGGNTSGGTQGGNTDDDDDWVPWVTPAAADVEYWVLYYINQWRGTPAVEPPILKQIARIRSQQLVKDFRHTFGDDICTPMKYGKFMDYDPDPDGDTSLDYYRGYSCESIGHCGGTAPPDREESPAQIAGRNIARLFKESNPHWMNLSNTEMGYMAVGITYKGGTAYVCILQNRINYG